MASIRDTMFVSNDSKTFEYEDALPSLPVPPLRHTLDVYLDSVKAVVTEDEYKETEQIVRNFETGIGCRLQSLLLNYAKNQKNWLEKWWEEIAYLMQRSPLLPFSNMTGNQPFIDLWPIKWGTRAERLALMSYFNVQFWQLIRDEKLKPTIMRGTPWSMFQFKRIFNSCRIPGEEKDTLISSFRTESEGPPASTNIVVLYRGYIFTFDLYFEGDQLTPPEIEKQIRYIEQWCQKQRNCGPGVGALTTTERTKWAQNRQYLKSLSVENERILDIIENSMLVSVFDDKEPITQLELLRASELGNCSDRWADKSLTHIGYANGTFSSICDHTPFDAIIVGLFAQYMSLSIVEYKGEYNGPKNLRDIPLPEFLEFVIDDKIVAEIESAKNCYHKACDDIELVYDTFREYGRSLSASHRIHPEAYIQIAIQLAYYRTHGKPGTTYCTATTRKFFHGRTETCRTCTPEAVEFARAFVDGNTSDSELYLLLQKAAKKFEQIMTDACNGNGCDRHFIGLYLIAMENGIDLPEIFTDSSFIKTGGNGNYVLSTSCAGYWKSCGSVPAMTENGYSCFYGIENNQYSFNVSAFKSNPETDAKLFFENIRESLRDMKRILDQQSNDIPLRHNL